MGFSEEGFWGLGFLRIWGFMGLGLKKVEAIRRLRKGWVWLRQSNKSGSSVRSEDTILDPKP